MYNLRQRQIMRKVRSIKAYMKTLRKKYLELDVKVNALKHGMLK